jgi:hypothetical protein
MKRITIIRALAALAVVIALAAVGTISKHAVPAVYAASGCSNATLNGNYSIIQPAGFTTHNSTTGNEIPWQFAGFATFDGKGAITSTNYTAAVNGAIYPNQNYSGTYSVGSDCTGTLSLPAIQYGANIYVIGSGAEFFGISSSLGDTASFDAKRQ